MNTGKERRAAMARRILHRTNAQEILKALQELEERRPEFRARWLWELMQNARDFPDASRSMIVRITVTPEQVRFAHNGRAFAEEEILSLIYHGSTKQDNPELLGKFGTGFLSTHLLSRKVCVRGTLIEENGRRTGFQFQLDRSGREAREVGDAMENSLDAFEQSLSDQQRAASEWTEYVYDLGADSVGHNGVTDIYSQLDAIPYVLAFDEKLNQVSVELPGFQRVFSRSETESLPDGTPVVVLSEKSQQGSTAVRLAVISDPHASVALPLEVADDGTRHVLGLGAVPQLFLFLPLVGSSHIGLPAIVHSPHFMPVEARDGLILAMGQGRQSDVNRQALEHAAELVVRLAESCSRSGCIGLHRLLRIRAPSTSAAWIGDRGWYTAFQYRLLFCLAAIPLIRTTTGTTLPASESLFPADDDRLSWRATYDLALAVPPSVLPHQDVVEECSSIFEGWGTLVTDGDRFLTALRMSAARLLLVVKETGSLEQLSALLGVSIEDALAWLNRLIVAVPEDQLRRSFDGLLPDQSAVGTFRSLDKLARDSGIDEGLKDILEGLGERIRERLLHLRVSNAEKLLTRIEEERTLVTAAKELVKKRASTAANPIEPEFRRVCLALLAWLARRGRWADLRDSFPVLTLDRGSNETLTKTSDRAPTLVVPRALWPQKAQPFWDALPPASVLVDDYCQLLSEQEWNTAAQQGLVLRELLWSVPTAITNSEFDALTFQDDLEGDEHCVAADTGEIVIGRMAFVGTEAFSAGIRKSRERAIRFMRFLLEYAAGADDSWRRRERVPCECGGTHTIVPCEWLAWVRRHSWVPRRKAADKLTNESLAVLTRHDPHLAEAVTRKEAEEFLEVLGINVLEQALLATDEEHRQELRRRLAQLTKLAAQNPGEVEKLMRDIEARQEAGERWKANQDLGKAVERVVGEGLQQLLAEIGIRVDTHFVGYDLEAYFEGTARTEEDVGSVQLEAGTLVAKIEIKATRGGAVSMSYVQGAAAVEDRGRYWLCVVPLPPDEELSELAPDQLERLAYFVRGIGEVLEPSRNSIATAVRDAVEGGFELRNVEDIRYGITQGMWEQCGIRLSEFVGVLACTVAGTTR